MQGRVLVGVESARTLDWEDANGVIAKAITLFFHIINKKDEKWYSSISL